MRLLLDTTLLVVTLLVCWQGYCRRRLWFELPVYLLLRIGRGGGFVIQLLLYGLPIVGWLLLCHRIDTAGWHATAAGGMVLAMTTALEAMRIAEEEYKLGRAECDTGMEQ
ncbi:MAG: hypothetical protein Q9M13_02340 [Mariprofundales bacterium]|nr:hypothetical protein [Mariprofundales bacterium]